MGMNYFAIKRKLSPSEKLYVLELIVNNEYERAGEIIPKKIHIGKGSAGWQFIFNHNNWDYFRDSRSLVKFLTKCVITNEHDEIINSLEFLDMVNAKAKDKFSSTGSFRKGKFVFSTSTEFC
jgi:hypothetical protein